MGDKVNISQVAKAVGVSVSTVSRALSRKGRISESTREKICMVILRILRKKGIPVPERIKVASLHNSNLLDEWYLPDIQTMSDHKSCS